MDLFHARWSDRIHEEWIAGVLRDRPELLDRLARTRELMNLAVEDSLGAGFDSIITMLSLPDLDDRHVLAAAIKARADVIVTLNLKDFPEGALTPYGIEALHPDAFIRRMLDEHEPSALAAVRSHRASLKAPPFDSEAYLQMLLRQGLAETVLFLRPWSGLI